MKFKNACSVILFIGLIATNISCVHNVSSRSGFLTRYEDFHVTEDLVYSNSPFNELIDDAQQNKNHYAIVLNNGDDALLTVLHSIRNAKKSIFIQTFIWSIDQTSRFLTYELIQAAKRGVKVKIIIDYFILSKQPELIAFLTTAHPNLQVKLYNPVSNSIAFSKLALFKKAFLQFRSLNQRMHNKVLIVDDRIGITGGRNYQNDYYDRGTRRNFKDCDVVVIGPIVRKMTDSFIKYWSYPLSISSKAMKDVQRLIKNNNYKKYLSKKSLDLGNLFRDLEKCESTDSCLQERIINRSHKVENIKFIADEPGKTSRIGKYKTTRSTHQLYQFLEQANESIIVQTPYLVVGKKGTKYFNNLARKKPNVEFLVSSNSLASADHIHAYAFSYKNKKKYLKDFHWQIFEFKLNPKDIDLMITPINKNKRTKNYITTIHSKVYVVDHKKVWIGSFNLDPRSANLNTEVGIIIEDEAVAKEVEQDIRRDMASQNSWTIAKRKQMPLMSHFSGLISNIMAIVPIVDVWPFTYSGSYELKEGKRAVPFFDKDFYDSYRYVGPFPEVKLTDKEIKARLIKSFLGTVQPLI